MNKKRLLKLLPYLAAIITGGIFYFLALSVNQKYYDLLINIAATFFAIPLLYFFYETAKSFSHKKLNKEIFDYAKMQIHPELLSILNQLQKIVYTLENKSISKFFTLQKKQIEKQMKENKYLGFQIFKHWEISEKSLRELLRNPFILGKMEDEQIISIIKVLRSLRALETIQETDKLYLDTKQKANGYKVQSGIEMNPENKKLPDRCILLKHLTGDEYVVYDFGDIARYNLEKCLNYYEINKKFLRSYAEVIFDLLSDINSCLNATRLEFVVNTEMFKMRGKHID